MKCGNIITNCDFRYTFPCAVSNINNTTQPTNTPTNGNNAPAGPPVVYQPPQAQGQPAQPAQAPPQQPQPQPQPQQSYQQPYQPQYQQPYQPQYQQPYQPQYQQPYQPQYQPPNLIAAQGQQAYAPAYSAPAPFGMHPAAQQQTNYNYNNNNTKKQQVDQDISNPPKCRICSSTGQLHQCSAKNKAGHALWLMWRCPRCQSKDSFISWFSECPMDLPTPAVKGITNTNTNINNIHSNVKHIVYSQTTINDKGYHNHNTNLVFFQKNSARLINHKKLSVAETITTTITKNINQTITKPTNQLTNQINSKKHLIGWKTVSPRFSCLHSQTLNNDLILSSTYSNSYNNNNYKHNHNNPTTTKTITPTIPTTSTSLTTQPAPLRTMLKKLPGDQPNVPAATTTPTSTATKKQKNKNYVNNPCVCKNKNKFLVKLYHKIIQTNHHPQTYLEKKLYRVRNNYNLKHNITKTPSPVNTKGVIYALYSIKKHAKKLYIGQTTNTAYNRLVQHQNSTNNYLINKYITAQGIENIRVFVLQSTNELDKYERYWIHNLQTQYNNNNTRNLNIQSCNRQSRKYRKIISKINNTSKQLTNRNVILNHKKTNKITTRIYRSHDWCHRLNTLFNNNNIENTLKTYKTKTLSKFMSILNGKIFNLYKHTQNIKTNNILTYETTSSSNIKKLNKKLTKNYTKKEITLLKNKIIIQLKNNITINKKVNFIPIVITHTDKQFSKLNIKNIIKATAQLLPDELKDTNKEIKLVNKNSQNNAKLFFNYKTTSTDIYKRNYDSKFVCKCHKLKYKEYINHHGHIDTNDTSILTKIKNNNTAKATEKLANKGANYILNIDHSIKSLNTTFKQDINNFINNISCNYNIDKSKFNRWKHCVLENISVVTNNYLKNKPQQYIKNEPYKHIKNFITKYVHNILTITPTDKLKNNMRFTCTEYSKRIQHYRITGEQILLNNVKDKNYKQFMEKSKQATYEKTNDNKEKTINKHKHFLEKYNIPITSNHLPYNYTIFKSHKIGNRGVTASANVTTTTLSKILHLALKHIIQHIKINNINYNNKNNLNKSWMIENSHDLINILEKLNYSSKPTSIQTYDIEGFYDNIDIKKLEKIVKKIIPKIFNKYRRKNMIINYKNNTANWTQQTTTQKKNHIILTAQQICELQIWHLNNTNIEYNGDIWRQIKGIGQGTNQSPDLADITLFYYENKFIKHHKQHNPKIAQKFSTTLRKMDDLLFINNNKIDKWLYKTNEQKHGIYPKKYFNIISDQPSPTQSVDYLDTNIHIINTPNNLKAKNNNLNTKSLMELRIIAKKYKITQRGNKQTVINNINKVNHKNQKFNNDTIWNTKTYNKTDKFNIKAINFPHYTSNTNHSIKTGSIIGRLHSYLNTNLYKQKDFTFNVVKLLTKLHKHNEYPIKLLINTTKKFLYKRKTIYNTTTTNVFNAIVAKFEKCVSKVR